MKTDIDYLRELEEHLTAAARRVAEEPSATALGPRRLPGRRGRLSARLVAACVAGFLAVGGGIGYVATLGSPSTEHRFAHALFPTVVPGAAGPVASASHAPADQAFGRTTSPSISNPNGSIVGPSVVKTAALSVRVPRGSFSDRYAKATEIAGTNGGYVATSTVQDRRTDSGTITVRVPADHFEAALNELRALGHVDRASISGQDVTARFVDLSARLRNAEDKVAVLRRLLAKARTIAATLRVSNALSSAELLVEELQGQIRVLQNRTDLGTIEVTLYEREPPTQAPPAAATHHTIGGAWKDAVRGFFGVIYSVMVGLGYLVPLTVLLALVAVLIWLGVRRARARVRA